jgi:hypothetical protein
MIDMIQTPDGEERRLGCLPPTSFPTAANTFTELGKPIMRLDQIKAGLTKEPLWARRKKFAGDKYIRNQRHFGSCNGWSTAGVLSRLRELRGEPYVCLSGADAYSQMNDGRDNGSVLSDGLRIVEVNGIAPESMVAWNQIYTHQISAEAKAARARFKGLKPYAVDSEEEFATGIYLGYMGVVAVHATNAFNQQDGDGLNMGVNGVGNHSVMIQDLRLGTNGDIWYDMANSWDVNWCDGGYTWLSWNRHLRECVKLHRFWLLLDTNDDTADYSEPPKVKE